MKKKKSKKKIIIGAAAVLVVAGGVTVAGQRNSTENQIPQVQVVTAEKGDVEEIVDATGTVGSEEEKTYYSPVNAELKTVSFAQGDVVKKGTKLIEFNTEDLEKDNRKAELNLKSTKYDTKDTRNKSDKAEKKQKDAKKNVQELETASDELAELQSDLASEKAIAEADSTSLTKEEKEKLKVTDNLSELDAKSAEELVKEGKKGITAEFNGIISKADIKQGAAVTQGMELFTIENTDKASVDVTLSKYDYNTVKEGQSVEITLGDNTYQGTVTKMSHIAVQNEKGTPVISATVSIDNPDEDIFLGVDAKVKIYAASAKNVVTLPVEVVNIGKEGSFCYVIEDGLVTKRNITTGISSEDYVEITDGIKEGEEVIADLGDYTEGMEVQAVPEQTGEDADE